jgi:hypothetical protein
MTQLSSLILILFNGAFKVQCKRQRRKYMWTYFKVVY